MDLRNSNLASAAVDSVDRSNNVISHKPSVKAYATKVFQVSTIGIISSIFTTHRKYRRLFKVFLSSLCIAGFICQCITFLNHVFEYPEVMDISLNRSKTYIRPAYTYCNNPINRSVFCSMYPQHCVVPSEEFCKKYSSYCGANATLMPKKEYYNRLPQDFQTEWILNLGSFPNALNIDRSFIRRRIDEFLEVAEEMSGPYLRFSSENQANACYSVHSLVESSRQPLQHRRGNIFSVESYDESFMFYVNETEMMNPRIDLGVYFSVHSSFEAVNPLEKGIYLKGGRTYKLFVEIEEEILLKEPFASNCTDYEEMWEKNNHTGPRTRKMCQDKCHLDSKIVLYGCAPHYTLYPHKESLCGDEIERYHPNEEAIKEMETNCFLNCRDECRSSTYTTEYYIQDDIEYVEDEELHRHIEVNIYLSNAEVKVLRHSPKYETVEVFSSVGGFMGCWLGIAMMDIIDVFGSIISVCRYAFRKGRVGSRRIRRMKMFKKTIRLNS